MSPSEPHWDTTNAIDVWKHFTVTGGGDKDRMMQVCNWLLTSSVLMAAFAVTQVPSIAVLSTPPVRATLVALAIILSIASSFIAVIYGGYANWNWAKANQIAPVITRACGSPILDPRDEPWTDEDKKNGCGLLSRWARCWAHPARTYERLVPIFLVYFWLSVLSAAADFVLMVLILRV